MKVGLFFGSFNPVHIGHLIVANTLREKAQLDEVWFVISPHNPFKNKRELAPAELRLKWVNLSVEQNTKLKASGLELDLPHPSYTFQTLNYLKKDQNEYHLILGSDTFLSLPKWKNASDFIFDYPIIVYNRPNALVVDLKNFPNARIFDLPLMEICATEIRKKCKAGETIEYFVSREIEKEVLGYYLNH